MVLLDAEMLSSFISYTTVPQVLNIILSFCRAFYNRNGVVEYRMKDIRQHYMGGPFVLDLLSSIPFRELFAAYGSDHKHATWLQLPRLLACWRIMAWVQEIQVRGCPGPAIQHLMMTAWL